MRRAATPASGGPGRTVAGPSRRHRARPRLGEERSDGPGRAVTTRTVLPCRAEEQDPLSGYMRAPAHARLHDRGSHDPRLGPIQRVDRAHGRRRRGARGVVNRRSWTSSTRAGVGPACSRVRDPRRRLRRPVRPAHLACRQRRAGRAQARHPRPGRAVLRHHGRRPRRARLALHDAAASGGRQPRHPPPPPGSDRVLPGRGARRPFSVGDGHLGMGDGEVCGLAMEAPLTGTVRLSLIKSMEIPYVQCEVAAGTTASPRAWGTT